LQPRGFRFLAAELGGHGHRLAALARENAFGLEQAVGLRDRHRVDGMGNGKLADRRQLVAGLELIARDHPADLIHELAVDRCAGLRIEPEHTAAWLLICIRTPIH
jgi:hypothetical protein